MTVRSNKKLAQICELLKRSQDILSVTQWMTARSHYTFDKRLRYERDGRLRLVICAAPDCRKVHHYPVKRGQVPKWCPGDRCRMRERQRRVRQIAASKHWPRKPRHKGVLGTQHWGMR